MIWSYRPCKEVFQPTERWDRLLAGGGLDYLGNKEPQGTASAEGVQLRTGGAEGLQGPRWGPSLAVSAAPTGPWPAVLRRSLLGRVGVISSQGPCLTDELHAEPLPGRWPVQKDAVPECLLEFGSAGVKASSKPVGLASQAGGSSEAVTSGGRYGSGHCSPGSLSDIHQTDTVGEAEESGRQSRGMRCTAVMRTHGIL